MAMRDYISINNYSGRGKIGISRDAIAAIARSALKEVPGAAVFEGRKSHKLPKDTNLGAFLYTQSGVKVVFAKDGQAVIKMDVTLPLGVSVPKVAAKIQETVAMAVKIMCDTVPFDVQVKVMRIV